MDTLFYLAGFFDGEGCIGLENVKALKAHKLQIQVDNIHKDQLLMFKKLFGGSMYLVLRNKYNPNHHDIWCWKLADRKAEYFLKTISPYLITKKKQALIALEYRKLDKLSNIPNIKQMNNETKDKMIIKNNKIKEERRVIYEQFRTNKMVPFQNSLV